MSQTLTYVIGQDRRSLVDNVQDFKVNFNGSNTNWVQARQYERSMRQVFVNVKNQDGTPFDLTGCNIWFEGFLPKTAQGDFRVIDDKGYVPLDPSSGRFRFDMPGHAFTVAGSYRQAFFRIVKDGNSVTTLEFDLEVLADKVIGGLVPRDYISPVEELVDEIENKYQASTTKLTNLTNEFIAKYTEAMNTLKALGATVKDGLDALDQKIKQDGLFTQAEADAFKQAIQEQIDNLSQKYAHIYNSLTEVKTDKSLISGMQVKTLGYYSADDGGRALYTIVDQKPTMYYEELDNGLYAQLHYTSKIINVAQFGVVSSQDDNYDKLQSLFDNYAQGSNIYFPNGTYKFSKTLVLRASYTRLVGDNHSILKKTTTNMSGYSTTFNGRVIDLSKQDVALIIGPGNSEVTSTYHHQIKLESIEFDSNDTTTPSRSNYGVIAIGTAYLSFDHCFIYGYYLNLKQYDSFGLSLSQTQSNHALTASLFLDKSIHVSVTDCGFESIRPQASAIVVANHSITSITNSVITMNGIAADTNSHLTLNNCSYETNYQTFRATAGATITVSGGDIERHQDPANSKGTPLIYCTDNSTVTVFGAKWRWQNYSGSADWSTLYSYTTNKGCKIVVMNCQFSNFPTFEHYDGGADYVIWDQDFDLYKQFSGNVTPATGVTIQGVTLERNSASQSFLNVGFTVNQDLKYMDTLLSFPPTFIPWDGCYIQFLQQSTQKIYQAFTDDGKIKVYTPVPAGTEAILTFSYQAQN